MDGADSRGDHLITIPGGRLIVVEGIDGCGKTTVARSLADYLRSQGRAVHLTRRPSDGPIGREIRRALVGDRDAADLQDCESAATLFAADLYDQIRREVGPALSAGKVVVSDRWYASSIAYQAGTDEADAAFVLSVNQRAPAPHLTLYLRVDPEVAARRRVSRAEGAQALDEDRRQRDAVIAYDAMFTVACLLSPSRSMAVLDGSACKSDVFASVARTVDEFLVSPDYTTGVFGANSQDL